MTTEPCNMTIDSEIIKKLEVDAKKEDRSRSYIANKILSEYYKIK